MNLDLLLAGSGIGVLLVIVRILANLSHPAARHHVWRRATVSFLMGLTGFVSVPLLTAGLMFGYSLAVVANHVFVFVERRAPDSGSARAALKDLLQKS